MYPILGRYGPFFLYSFTVVLGVGLAAGLGLTAWFVKKEKNSHNSAYPGWLDGLLISLLAGFIGGRIGFVWANWSYFLDSPNEIVLVWQGGLSYHGTLVSALLALWLWSRWQHNSQKTRSFITYAALLMPGLVLAHLFGWPACWLEGCVYGRETVLGLFAADLPDDFGIYAVRFQTQLIGLALTAVIFVLTIFLKGRLIGGRFFWLILGLLSVSQGLITLLRGDPVPVVGQIRLDTLISAGLVLISLIGFVFQDKRTIKDYRMGK
jgi:phosphatidylglycerol:prolipoprotein diacylglycerol transferase